LHGGGGIGPLEESQRLEKEKVQFRCDKPWSEIRFQFARKKETVTGWGGKKKSYVVRPTSYLVAEACRILIGARKKRSGLEEKKDEETKVVGSR